MMVCAPAPRLGPDLGVTDSSLNTLLCSACICSTVKSFENITGLNQGRPEILSHAEMTGVKLVVGQGRYVE